MKKSSFFLLISFISFCASIDGSELDERLDTNLKEFCNKDLNIAILIPSVLVALVNTVINAVLKENVNSNGLKVEVYPTVNKDFVITEASQSIAGKEREKKLARVLNETLLLGLVRVGIKEQLKTETVNNMRAEVFTHRYYQLKEEHPEWDEEQLQVQASALTTNEVESNQERIQHQIEEFSQTEEFTALLHNRWLYYTTRHLGGVMLSDLGSKVMQKKEEEREEQKKKGEEQKKSGWMPPLYDGNVHASYSTIAGIRASVPTLPILTNLSSKVHPNLTIKNPSISLDYAVKKSGNTPSFLVGAQATLFHSELLKIKINGSKNLSGGSFSWGISLEAGM